MKELGGINVQVNEIYAEFIRKKKKYTNCYFTIEELREQCSEKQFWTEMRKGSLLIWQQECGYKKLYFVGDDFCWINDFQVTETETVVIEIVTKGGLGEYDISKKMECKDVLQYTRFRRKGFSEPNKLPEEDAEYCTEMDIPAIRYMLETNFSAIGDYIPSDAELRAYIQNRLVICLRDERNIMGYIIFEDKGKTSYIRNLCVNKKYRSKEIGKKLMLAYFYMHKNFKGFTLWCKTTNDPALKLYTNWGGITMKTSITISSYAEITIEQGAA